MSKEFINSELWKKNTWGWEKILPKFLIKFSKLLLVFGVTELLSSDMYFFVKEWKIQFALESEKWIISFTGQRVPFHVATTPCWWKSGTWLLKFSKAQMRLETVSLPSPLSTGVYSCSFCPNTHRRPPNWSFFFPFKEIIIFNKFGWLK